MASRNVAFKSDKIMDALFQVASGFKVMVDFSWNNLLIILASTILFIIELILATGGEMLKD